MILARRKIGGKLSTFWPILRGSYLTVVCGVADNNGLFGGSGKVSSPEPDWLPSYGTLVAEVFSHEKSIWF